jgi:hypothetical protein
MNLKQIVNKFESHQDFLIELKKQVLKLASENPNFVYNPNYEQNKALKIRTKCKYNGPVVSVDKENKIQEVVGPDCKGCIFGQALQNMGWTDSQQMNVTYNIKTILRNFAGVFQLEFVDDQIDVLLSSFRETQNLQDSGNSWSNCVENLLESV